MVAVFRRGPVVRLVAVFGSVALGGVVAREPAAGLAVAGFARPAGFAVAGFARPAGFAVAGFDRFAALVDVASAFVPAGLRGRESDAGFAELRAVVSDATFVERPDGEDGLLFAGVLDVSFDDDRNVAAVALPRPAFALGDVERAVDVERARDFEVVTAEVVVGDGSVVVGDGAGAIAADRPSFGSAASVGVPLGSAGAASGAGCRARVCRARGRVEDTGAGSLLTRYARHRPRGPGRRGQRVCSFRACAAHGRPES